MFIQIAIDGASGVGKSTLAKALASSLNYTYINSGLIFRGLAWYLIKNSELSNEEALTEIIKYKHFYFDKNKWFLNDKEILETELINNSVSSKASEIAKDPKVRDFVLVIEREQATKRNIVMDGRDIGTKVFPEAKLKIFLSASLDVRAERRYKEFEHKGILGNLTIEDIKQHLNQRDKQDTERACCPLEKAEDAIEINVDNYSCQELTDQVINIIKTKNLN